MTVYVVIADHWETYTVIGVTQSLETAKAAAGPGTEWTENGPDQWVNYSHSIYKREVEL